MISTHFVQTGRWSHCSHCLNSYTSEHYCGAPWQTRNVVGTGINDLPETFAKLAEAESGNLTLTKEEVKQLQEILEWTNQDEWREEVHPIIDSLFHKVKNAHV